MLSLLDIKRHLMQVRMTTLTNLCEFFHADAETMRCLLQHWIRKGQVRQCMKEPACGKSCFKCPTGVRELYEWVVV